ncbi:trypsin-like peptidase domain-containing protein [Pseudonocardia sp. DSM 110487]|uniref:S1 family peptidase n=1 Tax=Pseudonocardia sp. DSM 110487 TaxID=2865833 RepID=UPI001C69B725|nr:serine protease [Pseudonocardia sp. DSM 110487]QYN31985.1 trypsin-like peptidase domain-containing protein [Pseudonocardia sp. DSM 110487]
MTSSSQDHTLAARVAARIITRGGDVAGAGFLVGPDLVATCAHVVASVAGADPYGTEPPPEPVQLDFPMLGAAARAVVHRWLPIAEDGTGDVAVLKLIDPLPTGPRMPPLRRIDQLWDQRFRVLGFPEGMADGVWTTGRIRGAQGTSWFQLQTTVGEQPIVQGFSGAPVWHEESGAVVGMTVAADSSGRTTTAYLIPVEQVLGADPELLPCPYRGLQPFGEEHAEFFFGREADVAVLADALAAHPLVAVVGPSGVGKSSLVGAGLVPRLRAEGARIAQLTPIPGQPVEPALTAALARLPPGEGNGRVILVVDQFEELAAAQPDDARGLLERVGELVAGTEPISAVLTLRSATLDEVLVPELAGLLGAGTVLVPPMQRGQLRDAIVAPAERAPGLSFEAGLVDRILDDAAAEPGHLPLVESLLTELWSRRDGGHLTVRAYEEAGGVAGVIATHAEAVLAGFTEPDDATRLRRLLTSLASPDRDGRFTRTPLPWADVAPDLRPVVHRLAAGRLVVVARSSTGTEHVQLAHQALIAHWPRLRDWLTEDRDFLAWRAQLDQQRERWEDTARDDGALLRGTALSTAFDWLPERSVDVSEAAREYVRRSQVRQRREVRRWRVVTAVLAVLVLAAGTLSVVAVTRGDRINDQLRLANAELVAQTALRQAGVDPLAATRLALTAWHLDPSNGAARTALVNQYLAMRSVEGAFPDVSGDGLDRIVMAPDGADRVLVRNGRGLALIDALATGRPERWDVPIPAEFRTAGLIDNGKTLIALASNGDVLRWDIATRSGPDRTPTGITPPGFASVEVDPAATKVGWIQQMSPGVHALELRDARTGAVIPHRIDPIADPGGVGVELPADPNLVVLQPGFDSSNQGPLTVRSLADGAERASFLPGSVTTSAVDGTVLSCEQDGSVAVLRALADGAEIRRFALLSGCSGEWPLLLTADGDHLLEVTASTGDSGSRTTRITRLSDGQTYGLALPPDTRNALNPRVGISMVVVGSDASPAVLLAHGGSVLRLRARPVPTNPKVTLWPVDDERYLVAVEKGRTIVTDRELRRLAELTDEQAGMNTDSRSYALSGLAVLTPPPQGWAISDFALPSLDRISTHRLEAPTTGRAPQVVVTKDRIISMSRRVVTAWDRATGAQLYEPTRLPEVDFRDTANFAIRPGHPDEIIVVKGLGAEIWDLRQRRRVADVPLVGSLQPAVLAFFPSGNRVVSLALGSNLEIRNVADLQPVRPAFPAPGTTLLLGVTQDNHILTLRNETDVQFVFWDAERGSASGTFTLPKMYRPSDVTEDGRQIRINAVNGGVPFNMPVTAQQWADRLCTIADQPFTDEDRALLPAGVEADHPCPTG